MFFRSPIGSLKLNCHNGFRPTRLHAIGCRSRAARRWRGPSEFPSCPPAASDELLRPVPQSSRRGRYSPAIIFPSRPSRTRRSPMIVGRSGRSPHFEMRWDLSLSERSAVVPSTQDLVVRCLRERRPGCSLSHTDRDRQVQRSRSAGLARRRPQLHRGSSRDWINDLLLRQRDG